MIQKYSSQKKPEKNLHDFLSSLLNDTIYSSLDSKNNGKACPNRYSYSSFIFHILMDWYLKCYYGYKNWWDELLALWSIQWIFSSYDVDTLYIEAWDPQRMKQWLHTHQTLLSKHIYKRICVVGKYWHKISSSTLLFLGGGELFTDQRTFPYDGWTYVFRFWKKIFFWKVIMLWWIGTVKKLRTRLLYRLTLSLAHRIVCRDKLSFAVAKKYSQRVELYRDFALDVMDIYKQNISIKDWSYSLINVNSHIMKDADHLQKIAHFAQENSSHAIYFFPCDMYDDLPYYTVLCQKIPHLKLYDRTKHSVQDSLQFIAWSSDALWTRLHFLLVLKYFDKHFLPIVYQEKIEKMILYS